MSSNDYILIKRKGKNYTIHHRDVESDGDYEVRKAPTARKALEKAMDILVKEGVEYGILYEG